MNGTVRIVAAGLALAGLMLGVAAHATNLADRPLKASVFAKPNVIFGLDDSASMDSEVMLYNNDGAFWWDYDSRTGWGTDAAHPNPALRSLTATLFNAVGAASSKWRKMTYLFPNGSGTGNRVLIDSANDHFAVLPTSQFAFLRWSGISRSSTGALTAAPTAPEASTLHNPLYYNPMLTYRPWAPAQLAGDAVTPAAANPAAARSHPIYGSGTVDLTQAGGVALSTTANNVFTAFPGMTLPGGSQVNECDAANANCTGWVDLAADRAATAGKVTRVAMAYFPATFWVKESCTVPAVLSAAGDDCTTAPDGSTLKRYQIRSGATLPFGRDADEELQNFANWFQYHRKRKQMLSAAMGDTLENITNLRLGVVRFNSRSNVTMYDADATTATTNRRRVAGIFYETNGTGVTPTRQTLAYIGEQFKRLDTAASGAYNVVQYACQRNNAFLVTDGFADASSVTTPAYDSGKSAATWGAGVPYETIYSPSLADLALRYYTNNPRSDLSRGALPATATDRNTDLHMNTYGLSLGARGTLFLNEASPVPTTPGAWPNPTASRNPTAVDDLWHATINGRGKMYLATTPEETALRIQAGLADIVNQEGSQASIAVSAINLSRGDTQQAYIGSYNTVGWGGDLSANAIDRGTGAVSTTATWNAAALLATRSTARRIFSASGNTGIDFDAAGVGGIVNPDPASFTNEQVVAYLRGDRSLEGTLMRRRTSLMGAVINAEPVLARDEGVVYVASSEGLLHAFDTTSGAEQWAFAPPDVLAGMGASVQRTWDFKTLLDGTPTLGRMAGGGKLLVGGLGAAGRSYYALDVSSPRNLGAAAAAAQFRWVFPAAGSALRAQVGYTIGRPVVTRTAGNGDVVLVTSGVDKGESVGDGLGRLWMLSAADGSVLKTFRTTAGSTGAEAGLTHISAYREPNGSVRYAYGGDLLGNLWRFDLATAGAGEHDATLVASLRDAAGTAQPITAAPEIVQIKGRRILLIGTGRLLDISDFGSSARQSFYAIADGSTLANARTSLVQQVFTRGATPELTGNAFDWSNDRGWYFDLPAGEQANTDPTVTYGAVSFVTNMNGATDCSQSAYLYLVDIGTGSQVAGAYFTSDLIASNATSSRLITLRVIDGRVIGTAHRSDNTVYQRQLPLGGTIPPSKNAWREIRR